MSNAETLAESFPARSTRDPARERVPDASRDALARLLPQRVPPSPRVCDLLHLSFQRDGLLRSSLYTSPL